jgi:proteasome component ECM29
MTAGAGVPHSVVLAAAAWPVQELPGRIWEGKEALLGAAGALGSTCAASLAPEQRRRLVAALLDAAGKQRVAFRKEALTQLVVVLRAFGSKQQPESGHAVAAAGDGAVAAAAVSASAAGEGAEAEAAAGYYEVVAPLMLELARSFVEAAHGGGAMDTDSSAGGKQKDDEEPHPGKAVPAGQVAACLAAAFATTAPDSARRHADAAAAALVAVLDAAGKPADQLAVATAGCLLASHAARVAGHAPQQAAVLSPEQPGVSALLQTALRLGEEGKVSQLREQCFTLRCVPFWAGRHCLCDLGMSTAAASAAFVAPCRAEKRHPFAGPDLRMCFIITTSQVMHA